MGRRLEIKINNNNQYNTIKDVLYQYYGMSTRLISSIKNNGKILVNGKSSFVNQELNKDDILTIIFPEEISYNIIPKKMNIDIKYEDQDILVINKPYGMLVHPCKAGYDNTLANGVVHYWKTKNEKYKFRPVSRLDKNTSGLIIIAKNQYAHQQLSLQLKENKMNKRYIGVVDGIIKDGEGIIDSKIARKKGSIIERCVSNAGQKAITHFKLLKYLNNKSILEFILETGRTHQIRVHLKSIGHPLTGDTLYGGSNDLIDRQALHAYRLELNHPIYKYRLLFYSKLPFDIRKVIK